MKKRMTSMLLALSFFINICPITFAMGEDIPNCSPKVPSCTHTPYSDSVTTPEEQWQHEKEIFAANPALYKIPLGNEDSIMPTVVDPGEGSVNISLGNLYTTGTIYWDSEKKGTTLNAIADIFLTVLNGKAIKAISLIKNGLAYLQVMGTVDMSRPSEVKRGHSISYRNRAGEFYYNSRWETAVLTQERYFFEYNYFVVVVDGITHQETIDKIPENGFEAYCTETSAHFNDTTFIREKTLELYRKKKSTGGFGLYDERWF